jgi:hypothetical protein
MFEDYYKRGLVRVGFHENQIPRQFRNYFRFSCVRNPYTRAVSLWWSACRLHPPDSYGFREGCGSHDDFTRFIVWLAGTDLEDRHPLMMNQVQWLAPCEPIHVVHTENLRQELKQLRFWLRGTKLVRKNTTDEKIEAESRAEGQRIRKPDWRELYRDREAREAVLRWAGEDFERFGYSPALEE